MAEILSRRGNAKFSHGGHLFTFSKYSANRAIKFWRCDKRSMEGCKTILHTDAQTNEVITLVNEHTHGSNASAVEVAKILTTMRKRAQESIEMPSEIFDSLLESVPLAIRGQMPTKNAFRQMVKRRRSDLTASQASPAAPVDLASITIPDSYQGYEFEAGQHEKFLLVDSGEGDAQRILIFGRQSCISWSSCMKVMYVDGTFSCVPLLFSQLCVVMTEREGFVVPVLYALLPNKQQETYQRMFEYIKELWPDFAPDSFSVDFEQAALNAIQAAFPEAEIFGCLFHLTQSMRQKLISEGLMIYYDNDPEFSLAARVIVALAFVPPSSLDDAMEQLTVEIPELLRPILNWFEDTYVGRFNRNAIRQPATFPLKFWSCYERTLNGLARTNRYVEIAHRRVQGQLGKDPTFWKFIGGICKVQAIHDKIYAKFVTDEPKKKRPKHEQIDNRILNVVCDFQNRTLLDYLRDVGHNFLI